MIVNDLRLEANTFISFAANTKRPDACKDFWAFITDEDNYKKDTA